MSSVVMTMLPATGAESMSNGATIKGPGGRQQLSSCDHCRSRKKKCDARQRMEEGSNIRKCSRCQDNGLTCSFDFVTQKKMAKISEIVMRETKNRSKKPKLVSVANARILPKADEVSEADVKVSPNSHGLVSPSAPSNGTPQDYARESSTSSIQDFPPQHQHTHSHTHSHSQQQQKQQQKHDGEYFDMDPFWPTPMKRKLDDNYEPQVSSQHAQPLGEFSMRQLQNMPHPGRQLQPGHSLARRVTGITPALELKLLDEYMDLVYYQLPVFDSDQVYMRYRFCFPTPLPTYLLKTLIALGAAYTCRRPPNQAIVNSIQARHLYDDARQCIMTECINDASVDAIAALMLISFHWQDELTSIERERTFSLSVAKVQALRLHTNEGLLAQRTRREIGQLKLLVWINYVMDAFSVLLDLESFQTKDKWMSVSYLHNECTIDAVDEIDLEFMHIDLLTGKRKESSLSTEVGIFGAILYFEAIIGISRAMNEAQRLKEQGLPMTHLIGELTKLESESFSVLDFRSMVVEMMDGMYKGLISLNFTFWYAVLFINFDGILPLVTKRPHTPHSPELLSHMSLQEQVERSEALTSYVTACVEAAIAMLDIFEKLQRNGLLAQTSQICREQLYLGGYIIQLFYRERVGGVGDDLLSRWESCLEISELVWGFSARGTDLGRRLQFEELD